RINGLRRIHEQRSLVLNGALDGDPAIGGANYPRNHGQRGFELLGNEGQGLNLLVAECRGRSRCLRRGLGGLGRNLHLLVEDNLEGKLDLEGYGCFALAKLDAHLGQRFVTQRRTGHPVGAWNQPRKLESPSLTSSYRTP